MNTDSKLKRYVVLLDKAPFILFLESANYLPHADHLIPALNMFSLSFTDVLGTLHIEANQDLRKIISATNTLEYPLAYNIIEALADALPNNSIYFPVHFFTKSDWQNYIEWWNVDIKQEPVTYEFTITIDKITHKLHIIYNNDLGNITKDLDSAIGLSSVNIDVPFPKVLLKECVADIYEIIKIMSMNREPGTIAKSKYMSAIQTGHETFYWANLKKIEKDLIAILNTASITIEQ